MLLFDMIANLCDRLALIWLRAKQAGYIRGLRLSKPMLRSVLVPFPLASYGDVTVRFMLPCRNDRAARATFRADAHWHGIY